MSRLPHPTAPTLVRVASLLLALASGGCAAAGTGGTAPPPVAVSWSAASTAGGMATAVQQGCRRGPGDRMACIERTLVAMIDQAGIGRTMEVLDTLVVRDASVRENAHALAHGLGISAYRSPGTLAETFAACPPSQMSGCYHGVIQGYFLASGRDGSPVGTPELDALCAPHVESPFLFFQCAHGMGHGLMALHGNDLPAALEACDLASEESVRSSCYGGVFMENIVLVTHPHHTAAGHAGHAGSPAGGAGTGHDHAGHAGHGAAAAHDHGAAAGPARPAWRPLDRTRPLYPCTEVDERYHEACYTMQSSAILFFNGGDVAATARACEQAPPAMVAVCIASLGRDVTALAAQDHRRSIELCARTRGVAGGQAEGWCLGAVAENLVNLAADPDEGLRFCRAVPGAENKRVCYRSVGGSIGALEPGEAERARRCGTAEEGFAAACREGAGVSPSS
jgi:hypothetical protein